MRELLTQLAATLDTRVKKLIELYGRGQIVLMLISLAGLYAGGTVGAVLGIGGFVGVLLVIGLATLHENGRLAARERAPSRRVPRNAGGRARGKGVSRRSGG